MKGRHGPDEDWRLSPVSKCVEMASSREDGKIFQTSFEGLRMNKDGLSRLLHHVCLMPMLITADQVSVLGIYDCT